MTSTPHSPDERDLLDFADAVSAGENPQPTNDLERTFLHVQTAMQGESGAIPPNLKQSTWENVMSTLALAPERPVSNRTRRQQGSTSPPRMAARRRMQWTPMASVAAAVLVVLASVGIWTAATYESPNPPPEARQVAGIAPVPGEALQLATPAPKYACDFSQDMPILPADEQLPIDGTFLVWQEGGDLTLHCDEEPENIVLASGINQAGPVENIPGIATVFMLEEGATDLSTGYSVFINVTNGESFTTGNVTVDRGFFQQSWGDYRSGPFLFVHNEYGFLVILDTRSMSALPVGELFGEGAPQSFNLLGALSDDESTMALMLGNQEAANSGVHPMPAMRGTETSAEGDILLLDVNTGEISWLTLPIVETERLTGVHLSPDASMLAVTIAPDTEDMMSAKARVMIVSTQDGTVLAESDTFASFDVEALWTDSGLVVQAAQDILLIPTNGSETSVLYSQEGSNSTVDGLKRTLDPNVLVVTSVLCEGECTLADSNVGVVTINLSSGETERYLGQNIAYLDWADTVNLLLMSDPSVVSPDTTTYTVVDPVSGETVAEFDDVPGIGMIDRQMPLIGAKSISVSADGQTRIVAIGMQYIFELKSDGTQHSARLLPVPDRWVEVGSSNPTTSVFLSPGGKSLSAMSQNDEARTRFMLDLTDPDAKWLTVETTTPGGGGYILFVEGVPED